MRPYLKKTKEKIIEDIERSVRAEVDNFLYSNNIQGFGFATQLTDMIENAITNSMKSLLDSLGNEDDIDDTILE